MRAIFIFLIILSFNCYAELRLEDMSGTIYTTDIGETKTYPRLTNVKAFDTYYENGCLIDGQEDVKCWGTNFPELIPLRFVNPHEIIFEKNIACVIDNEGIKCWWMEKGEWKFKKVLDGGDYIKMAIATSNNRLCVIDSENTIGCLNPRYTGKEYSHAWQNRFNEIHGFIKPVQIVATEDMFFVLDDEGVKYYNTYQQDNKIIKIRHLQSPTQIASNGYDFCALDKHQIKCWLYDYIGVVPVPMTKILARKPDLTIKVSKNITKISMGAHCVSAVNGNNIESWELEKKSFWQIRKSKIFSDFKNPRKLRGSSGVKFCFVDDEGVKCIDFSNEGVWSNNDYILYLYLASNNYEGFKYLQNTFYPHLNSFHKRKTLLRKKYDDEELKFKANYKYFFTQLDEIFIDNFSVGKISDFKVTLADQLKSFKKGFDVEREKQQNLLYEMSIDVNLDYRESPIEVIVNKKIKQTSLELFRSAVKNSLGHLQEYDRQVLYSLIEQDDNDLENSILNDDVGNALQAVYLNPYTKPLGAVALALRGLF